MSSEEFYTLVEMLDRVGLHTSVNKTNAVIPMSGVQRNKINIILQWGKYLVTSNASSLIKFHENIL